MQTCHQPDIENIKAIFTRLSNRNGPARPPQEQELPMRDREDPAIGQVDLKWDERLGIVMLPQRFNCHALFYSMDDGNLQSAASSSRLGFFRNAASS